MNKLSVSLAVFSLFGLVQAEASLTYFECAVKESHQFAKSKTPVLVDVSVKFAVDGLISAKATGKLVEYPGADPDYGVILVTPSKVKSRYTMMTNLNGQGGDLRFSNNGDLKLFGDGDGEQFTDLVLWADGDETTEYTEGYVRDYGPTYADSETFKQFIKCKKSDKPL